MKRHFLFLFVLCVVAFGGISVSAQCDLNSNSHIKCGYYNEGYQDGVNDARTNTINDYRRYKDKFERKYEDFFRTGYEAGYNSVRPTTRWTTSQRNAYDAGYNIGQNDRNRKGEGRSAGTNMGQYDQNIGLYFQQGYNDGFGGRFRQYDVPLNGNTPYPGNPTSSGSARWTGSVDGRANLIIKGGTLTAQDLTGGLQTTYQNMNGSLPRRNSLVTARQAAGRGDVNVIQQPNKSNDFTAIVQIYDPKGGAGNYIVDINWSAPAIVEEPYRSGSINWTGRVDGTVNIIISGTSVESQDITGNGMYNVNYTINGFLAARPGTVSARKREGSGTVTVIQQPSRDNEYSAIVQVYDPNRGADNYRVEITW